VYRHCDVTSATRKPLKHVLPVGLLFVNYLILKGLPGNFNFIIRFSNIHRNPTPGAPQMMSPYGLSCSMRRYFPPHFSGGKGWASCSFEGAAGAEGENCQPRALPKGSCTQAESECRRGFAIRLAGGRKPGREKDA
jgi:hypothetical protein